MREKIAVNTITHLTANVSKGGLEGMWAPRKSDPATVLVNPGELQPQQQAVCLL